MQKVNPTRPVLIMLYGLPGSGKSAFARQLTDVVNIAHVSAERIRFELFEEPRFDKAEYDVINSIMNFMTDQFLQAGVSVVYDTQVSRIADRKVLREIAHRYKAEPLMVWLQIDVDTAFARSNKRDHRKADDKYAVDLDADIFERMARALQNPTPTEEYAVISGKHTFNAQRDMVLKKLAAMGIIESSSYLSKVTKPELTNMVAQAQTQIGRVDLSRRNITIR